MIYSKCSAFSLLFIICISPNVSAVELHWSKHGDRCWFRDQNSDDHHSFFIVDVNKRERLPAYDSERLAEAFSKTLRKEISADSLQINSIDFTDSNNELLISAYKKKWLLDLYEYKLTASQSDNIATVDRQLFLPPRKSEQGGESTHIHIHNQLQSTVQMVWIDFSGKQQRYGSIKPGEKIEQHTFVNHVWLLATEDGEKLGCFSARSQDEIVLSSKVINNVRKTRPGRPANRRRPSTQSPDGRWTAFLRDQQLWIKGRGKEHKLSTTGSAENRFGTGPNSPEVYWSPDSEYLVAMQTKSVKDRTVHFIESSPPDQLQPRVQSFPYRKPGDELPTQTVRLYSIKNAADKKDSEIKVSQEKFPNPWSLKFLGWTPDEENFRLLYNQRGHQVLRLLEINAIDGEVRTLIDEQSDTFIHYSTPGKSVLENLTPETILWSSERTGWNHLYRYSAESGKVINAVTSGKWNVRRIKKIDRDQEMIWFDAVGIMKEQDPYHEHFCSVNFDGSNLQVLTEKDGTHQTEFEQNGQYFVDTYSRVDKAPIEELRETATGELICELTRQKTVEKFQDRPVTTRFVAKGRDGETDIWGIIHWPKDFDSNKKYPVVENIYAGPHDHHVPKAFRSNYRHQYQIADAGMIVVQIDGMGTAWRSKAFHDVCYKNLRDAGFPDRIAWIKSAAETFPQMDLERVGIYGGSAGGQNAMAALLWHNDFYKVAVADCGCHDNRMDKIWWNEQWMGWPVDESYKRNSNTENAHLLKGKLMLIVGELDRNVDPATTTQVVHQLIKHDKEFDFVLVAGAGHGAAETPWASRKRWNFLKKHLLTQGN